MNASHDMARGEGSSCPGRFRAASSRAPPCTSKRQKQGSIGRQFVISRGTHKACQYKEANQQILPTCLWRKWAAAAINNIIAPICHVSSLNQFARWGGCLLHCSSNPVSHPNHNYHSQQYYLAYPSGSHVSQRSQHGPSPRQRDPGGLSVCHICLQSPLNNLRQ